MYGLKETLINELIEYSKKYNITKLILFGSRARGDYRKLSDIDLAVSGGDVARFSADVQEETRTLLFFDIVNLDKPVQDELLESISREGITIYEKI